MVLVGFRGVLGVSGLVVASSLPVEVSGISFLLFPLFLFSLFPFPLVLGLIGGLLGEVRAWVLGRGWGLPLCFEVFSFFPFFSKHFHLTFGLLLVPESVLLKSLCQSGRWVGVVPHVVALCVSRGGGG